MFLFQKCTFRWCIFVLSVQLTSGEWTDQTITDFKEEALGGMGGQCLGQELLQVKKYEDFEGVFEKPNGANEYFATSSESIKKHCVENIVSFKADVNFEVRVLVYTSNIGGPDAFRFSIIDLNSSEILTTEVQIDDKNWTVSAIKLIRSSSYKIRLEYTNINDNVDAFFAIDKFTITFPTPLTTTTAGAPTEPPDGTPPTEVTTDPTNGTPPTEAPTDPTDGTPPTEAPTDPTDGTPSTEAPILISPQSNNWKIVSIVAIAVCSCFMVGAVFLGYFYFSIRQRVILPSKTKVSEPIGKIPRVVHRKADEKSTICDMPVDEKSITISISK